MTSTIPAPRLRAPIIQANTTTMEPRDSTERACSSSRANSTPTSVVTPPRKPSETLTFAVTATASKPPADPGAASKERP